jgi:hypothetical protein
MIEESGSGSLQIMIDPDPGSPKTDGSGSISTTLEESIFFCLGRQYTLRYPAYADFRKKTLA